MTTLFQFQVDRLFGKSLFGKSLFRKRTPRRLVRKPFNWPLAAEVELLEDRTLLSVSLGSAETFAVLGASTVTSTNGSVVTGNLGVSPGSAVVIGAPPMTVTGTIHANDAISAQAHADLATAYNVLVGDVLTSDLSGQDLGGLTLTPGVYHFASSAQLGAKLTLDAQSNPNAEWVFQIASTLTTASNSSVVMINGGNAGRVYWQIGSSATIGTGTAFAGHILALTSITVDHGASITGGALAVNGAVTMDDNAISVADSVSATYSFPGEYGVTTGGVVTLASITQSGSLLTLIGSSTKTATITNSTQILVNGTDTANYGNSAITFPAGTFAGQVWTKLDLPANYTNSSGTAATVVQTGTSLTFTVPSTGDTSPGYWTSPTQVYSTVWGMNGTVGSNKITWSNGQVWTENLVFNGSNNGSGTTTIAATLSSWINTYTNSSGAAAHVNQSGASLTFVVPSTGDSSPGYWINAAQVYSTAWRMVGTVGTTGTISWSNGQVWTGTTVTTTYTNSTGAATHVNQDGTSLTFVVNPTGDTSTGYWISPTQVYATVWGMAGTVGSTGTITWSNGQVWTGTTSLIPPVTTQYTNSTGAAARVNQIGASLTFIVDTTGDNSPGYWINPAQVYATAWGMVGTVSSPGKITWSNGQVWTGTTTILPSTVVLTTLTDSNGAVSQVQLTSPNTLIGLDGELQGLTATRVNGELFWSNGSFWTNFDMSSINALFEMGTGYP